MARLPVKAPHRTDVKRKHERGQVEQRSSSHQRDKKHGEKRELENAEASASRRAKDEEPAVHQKVAAHPTDRQTLDSGAKQPQ